MTAALILTIGCGRRGAEGDRLVIITPHWQGVVTEFTYAFEQYYKEQTGRDISLEWLDQGGTADDLRYVRSEFERSPEGVGIDLFYGGGIDAFKVLDEEGLLEPYKLPDEVLDKIPASLFGMPLYEENYHWYGAAVSGFGVMYNKPLMERDNLTPIERWADLARPEYFGLIAAADPSRSGTAHTMCEIILQSEGWEEGFRTLVGMSANTRKFVNTSSQIPKEVSSGEAVFGLAIDFFAYTEIDLVGPEKIGYVMPEGALVYNPDPIGILKGAPNREIAEMFLHYVMSEPGQKIWMQRAGTPGGPVAQSLNRASVMPSLYEEVGEYSVVRVNPFKLTSSQDYDADKASERYVVINDLIKACTIEPHEELKDAWQRWIAGGKNPEEFERFTQVPVSEEEMSDLAARWDDAAFRNETILAWTQNATRLYRAVP
jgi:ABC-type Fe3+ transport system substrate-binding protein